MKAKFQLLLLCLLLVNCSKSYTSFSYHVDGSKFLSYMDNSTHLYSELSHIPYGENDNEDYKCLYFTPYLANKPTGTAVIVFPGGSYYEVAGDHEGSTQYEGADIAPFYNEKGISVFVAHYRTATSSRSISYKQLLSDGYRVVRYIRAHSKEYKVDKNKIGVLGYSAGGNLAMQLNMHPEFEIDDPMYTKDDIDLVSNEVAFGILCYPVVSFDDRYTHDHTKLNFTNGNEEIADYYSGENYPSSFNKPLFIWISDNDSLAEGCKYVSNALLAGEKDCVFVTYPDGYHGVGTAQEFPYCSNWVNSSIAFMNDRGY